MKPLAYQDVGGYRLGSRLPLDADQQRQLHGFFRTAPAAAGQVLGGRQAVAITVLEGVGPVAIKHYARGGQMRRVNRATYCNWPRPRSEKEFRWLEAVRRIGVTAPRPIAFATRGRIFGRCWLVTAAIDSPQSLIQLPADGRQPTVYRQVATQIRALIDHGIWHRDLHPGNVLVDPAGGVHIIDFDKARYLADRRRLYRRYTRRWQRAIVKHGLPPALAQVMTLAGPAP